MTRRRREPSRARVPGRDERPLVRGVVLAGTRETVLVARRAIRSEQVAEMRRLRDGGLSATAVGAALGLSDSTVRNYWNGRSCIDCGDPVCASDGPSSSERCEPCSFSHQSAELLVWSRDACIGAALAWQREHGRPPTAADWKYATSTTPSATQLYGHGGIGRRYGWATWNDFLREAGLSVWRQGEHGRTPRRMEAAA